MDCTPLETRSIWDEWYSSYDGSTLKHSDDFWLSRYRSVLSTRMRFPVLDLGCGGGFDARQLTQFGMEVIAADYSCEALRICREVASRAALIQLDMRDGLPLRNASFGAVVANLSLHYFSWRTTHDIIDDIGDKLRVGGYLFARLNSKSDRGFAAVSRASGSKIEPDYHVVDGIPRRFFDSSSLNALFDGHWKVHEIGQITVNPYCEGSKLIWEIAVERVRDS
jgi:SAM-dependent methyltransferase